MFARNVAGKNDVVIHQFVAFDRISNMQNVECPGMWLKNFLNFFPRSAAITRLSFLDASWCCQNTYSNFSATNHGGVVKNFLSLSRSFYARNPAIRSKQIHRILPETEMRTAVCTITGMPFTRQIFSGVSIPSKPSPVRKVRAVTTTSISRALRRAVLASFIIGVVS